VIRAAFALDAGHPSPGHPRETPGARPSVETLPGAKAAGIATGSPAGAVVAPRRGCPAGGPDATSGARGGRGGGDGGEHS
jgi:hypothetical protein